MPQGTSLRSAWLRKGTTAIYPSTCTPEVTVHGELPRHLMYADVLARGAQSVVLLHVWNIVCAQISRTSERHRYTCQRHYYCYCMVSCAPFCVESSPCTPFELCCGKCDMHALWCRCLFFTEVGCHFTLCEQLMSRSTAW